MSNWLQGLRARRVAANIKPADMARIIGVTPNSYFRYEQGSRQLTLDKAFALADALGSTVDELRYASPELEAPIVPAADHIIVPEGWDV